MSDIAEELFGYRTEVKRLEAEIERLTERGMEAEAWCDQLNVEIERLRAAITTWARARAAMNGVKINTPECAAAFDVLGAAEVALALKETKP